MGIFNFNENNTNEELYRNKDGYIYGEDSRIIYHVPASSDGYFELPNGTKGLSSTAITELRNLKAKHIVIPGTFKKVNIQLLNFENLSIVEFREGIEEVKCIFDNKNAIDVILPSTIKKIGANNYPLVSNLILREGVIEIEKLFASHDTNLISVSVPGTLKIIPQDAFNQCKNLKSVILNEGVETSLQDVFRGTNNLRTLEIPSTYNGTINLSMDARSLSNIRGNSKYDGKNFEEEQNQILTIKIKREDKKFEFNIKRGEQPIIEIKQNIIKIKCINSQEIISIDCNYLEQGIYIIENETLKVKQIQNSNNTTIPNSQNMTEDMMNKLDIIFQNAYRDNITKRSDFISLPSEAKMQIKKTMKVLFVQIVKQFKTINTDYEMFDYLFTKALQEIGFEETINNSQQFDNFGSTGKKI